MFHCMVYVCLVELLDRLFNCNCYYLIVIVIMFQCMALVCLVQLFETCFNEGWCNVSLYGFCMFS